METPSSMSNNNVSQFLRALTAATTNSPYNAPDDWLFAQFIQRSLSTTKKRETMTEEELKNFTDMLQTQFRTIFPSGQVDSAALIASANQQALNNIYVSENLQNNEYKSKDELCCQQLKTSTSSQTRRSSFSKALNAFSKLKLPPDVSKVIFLFRI